VLVHEEHSFDWEQLEIPAEHNGPEYVVEAPEGHEGVHEQLIWVQHEQGIEFEL
jgi:hypothetical protein